ncbi:TIGR03808 family TAT-translocated repetitive protein [Oricola cellulosilytica]|uniref:TIGR03808 family TAT-translocated repetitive protein n=1 Tax=Oricola cellulosilytica TaxID=1429082 RepID=A0A4R0P9Y2_9HYPH|nr:TIGR03808 family TAT-translocated repetitive protein [Oricola cellulosilytica]TCD14070.1 TIGR03808 family TAT-translocated repetitive protein [Oricola cellulosilytica]
MQRRRFLSRFGTVALASAVPGTALAQMAPPPLAISQLRGTRSATDYGVVPGAIDNQSARFQAMVDAAARDGIPLFLPAGDYILSNITLRSGVTLSGVPGRTRLIYGGGGFLLHAEEARTLTLESLTLDGVNRRPADYAEGLADFRAVTDIRIDDCTIGGAGKHAIYLERCSGRVRENAISGARQFAIFAVESKGITISDNVIESCANGGVVIHRWQQGRDGSIVTGNRITNTGAANGGTGQWGNAINLFRTDDTIVANNMISGSAFSAIRGNSTRGVQIIGNNCRSSGETAIYAEFSFENAVIANNLVDGAANGISVTNFDHGGRAGTVSGNIVRNLVATGPYVPDAPGFGTGIAVEADATVTGNIIEGAPLFGINAGWGPFLRDVVISANTVRDARYGIGVSAAEGAGRALIRGNVVSAREAAIVAHAWGEPLGPDLARDPAAAPANVTVADNTAT